MPKRELNAKDLIGDIRSGINDFDLMNKYKLTPKGLHSTFRKLAASGLISRTEMAFRKSDLEETVDLNLETALAERSSGPEAKIVYSFSGRVENVDLLDYLQWILLDYRRTVLEVRSPNESLFRLFINDGQVIHATNGEIEGEEAFYHCMKLRDGEFVHFDWIEPEKTTIEKDGTALLFEASRRRDESRNK